MTDNQVVICGLDELARNAACWKLRAELAEKQLTRLGFDVAAQAKAEPPALVALLQVPVDLPPLDHGENLALVPTLTGWFEVRRVEVIPGRIAFVDMAKSFLDIKHLLGKVNFDNCQRCGKPHLRLPSQQVFVCMSNEGNSYYICQRCGLELIHSEKGG